MYLLLTGLHTIGNYMGNYKSKKHTMLRKTTGEPVPALPLGIMIVLAGTD